MRVALAVLALALAARAGVTVVDPAGGPGAGLLQAAINAAPDGEILVLKPGDYTGANIVVSGKVLSLVGDGDPSTIVLRNLHLVLPTSSDTCLVRGLSIIDAGGVNPAGLLAESQDSLPAKSSVWVEGCSVHGTQISGGSHSEEGIRIDEVFRTVLVRTEARGGDGWDESGSSKNATAGGHGLTVLSAMCTIDECQLTGGKGGDGNSFLSTNGGDGARIFGYAAFMGCSLQGGDSGSGPTPGKQAGNGLFSFATIVGFANSVRDTVAMAGNVVGSGNAGEDILVAGHHMFHFPAVTRGLVVPAPLREGQDSVMTLKGEAGDAVFLQMSTESSVLPLPGKQGGSVLGGAVTERVFVAVLPPGGTTQVPIHVPDLPPGTEGVVMYLQPFMLTHAGGTVTGSGSALVWIDAAL